MANYVIVQYCPIDTTVGRYALVDKDNFNFINDFTETCKASDSFCKYIVLILENDNLKTIEDIRAMCKETIRRLNE